MTYNERVFLIQSRRRRPGVFICVTVPVTRFSTTADLVDGRHTDPSRVLVGAAGQQTHSHSNVAWSGHASAGLSSLHGTPSIVVGICKLNVLTILYCARVYRIDNVPCHCEWEMLAHAVPAVGPASVDQPAVDCACPCVVTRLRLRWREATANNAMEVVDSPEEQ